MLTMISNKITKVSFENIDTLDKFSFHTSNNHKDSLGEDHWSGVKTYKDQ